MHIRLGKAQHIIETGVLGNIPTDVVTARKVIQGNGRHTYQKNTAEHDLEYLEIFPVEPAGVGQPAEPLLSAFTENNVGEVVILIHNEV